MSAVENDLAVGVVIIAQVEVTDDSVGGLLVLHVTEDDFPAAEVVEPLQLDRVDVVFFLVQFVGECGAQPDNSWEEFLALRRGYGDDGVVRVQALAARPRRKTSVGAADVGDVKAACVIIFITFVMTIVYPVAEEQIVDALMHVATTLRLLIGTVVLFEVANTGLQMPDLLQVHLFGKIVKLLFQLLQFVLEVVDVEVLVCDDVLETLLLVGVFLWGVGRADRSSQTDQQQ